MQWRRVDLNSLDLAELRQLRDSAATAYVRERAAAILKVWEGQSGAAVARGGLLRPRKAETVYAWLDRFREEGVRGLQIRAGRGRKPAFSPSGRR